MPRNRMKRGEYKTFHINGRLLAREFYKNGKLNGKSRYYWGQTGRLWMEQFFRNGRRDGSCRFWASDGYRLMEDFYRNGIYICSINQTKRNGFVLIKRLLRTRSKLLDQMLIFDLVRSIQD